MNGHKSHALRRVAALVVVLAAFAAVRPAIAAGEIADSCAGGGTGTVSITTSATDVFTPGTNGYTDGSVRQGVTSGVASLACAPAGALSAKVEVYILLPGGLNYATCLAAAGNPLLLVLSAASCATVNQAAVGTLVPVALGTSSTSTTCSSCATLTATRSVQQQATGSNGNIAFAYGVIAPNLPVTLPASPVFAAAGPASITGIYEVIGTFFGTAKRYGQWIVSGENPPVAIPGCDGSDASRTTASCIPTGTLAPAAPDPTACQANPAGGDPVCPPPAPTPPPVSCTDNPAGGDPICPPPAPTVPQCVDSPAGPICKK